MHKFSVWVKTCLWFPSDTLCCHERSTFRQEEDVYFHANEFLHFTPTALPSSLKHAHMRTKNNEKFRQILWLIRHKNYWSWSYGGNLGEELYCLALLLKSLSQRRWRESPKRYKRSKSLSIPPAPWAMQTQSDQPDHRKFTNMTPRRPSMILTWLIFMFQTEKTSPAD